MTEWSVDRLPDAVSRAKRSKGESQNYIFCGRNLCMLTCFAVAESSTPRSER